MATTNDDAPAVSERVLIAVEDCHCDINGVFYVGAGADGDGILYQRVPQPSEQRCVLCDHSGFIVNGKCAHPVLICSDDYHGTRSCDCKCQFSSESGKLIGCPWCGVVPEIKQLASISPPTFDITCRNRKCPRRHQFGKSPEEATKFWNTRACVSVDDARLRQSLSLEHQTMFDLLAYPNPEGLHLAECRHRDFERALLSLINDTREPAQ